ncbi:VWA domain-containing protein [Neomegalonema sp.]|uniref:VWA domain-containing protein n=1 Tax=Neomegalonema sp. TaxID=2039713 RepID=UPI00262B94C0|nr:VWA domain-containing protein [Neomegalonema sp.]MDD2867356.1 VWA domain-containing protein [Neomegalonema sp.]
MTAFLAPLVFLHPWFLLAGGLCLLRWIVPSRLLRGDDWPKVLSGPVLGFLRPGARPGGGRDPTWLVLGLLCAALASPALPRSPEESEAYRPTEGLILLIDLSRSMTLADLPPSRLAAARAAAARLIDEAGARPAALILYAGDAYLAQPLAVERSQIRQFLAALEPEILPTEGSDLGRALALARGMIEANALSAARVLVLGDGGGASPAAESEARALAALGARLDLLRMARPETVDPSPVDPARLEALARAGGGEVLTPDALGVFDLRPLALDAPPRGDFLRLPVSTEGWRNLSHWLLLLALPLTLLLFRRARA